MFETLWLSKEERARKTPKERFDNMASRHGETIGFIVEDLRALPNDRARRFRLL